MKLDDFVAVSGTPNIYRIVTAKNNGILVEDIDEGKNKFFPSRKHQFTPLGTISIYTLEDTIELSKVFERMVEKKSKLPIPAVKSDKMVLLEYFENIVPDYDEDRVYLSDIKKVIKWFTFLDTRNLLESSEEDEKAEEDKKAEGMDSKAESKKEEPEAKEPDVKAKEADPPNKKDSTAEEPKAAKEKESKTEESTKEEK